MGTSTMGTGTLGNMDPISLQYQNNFSLQQTKSAHTSVENETYRFFEEFDEGEFCFNRVHNMSYLNVSCDTVLAYSVPLYGYCMPFLLMVTITANTLIVIVLSKRGMHTPTNIVLKCMALCDMFTVLFPAPGLIYMYSLGNHYKPLSPVAACYAYNTFNEIIPAIFHTASIWLTLALAVQRYIYVCHAPVARTWCTMSRVKRWVVYIMLAAILHQSTRFVDRSYELITIDWNGQEVQVCHITNALWIDVYLGENVYYIGYFLFRVLFVHLIPCACLVTLNILLFKAMKRAQEKREKLFRENRKKECKKLRDANCTTLMLIVVVTVFLIVEIPIAVITFLHIVSSAVVDFLDYRVANMFILFANFFLIVSYPINFAIYCGMSRQFRETFGEIFMRGGVSAKKDPTSKYSFVNGPRTCTNETVL